MHRAHPTQTETKERKDGGGLTDSVHEFSSYFVKASGCIIFRSVGAFCMYGMSGASLHGDSIDQEPS